MEWLTWDLGMQGGLLAIGVVGVYLNNIRKSCNFYLFMFTYAAWAIVYFYHGVYGASLKELIFIGFNIHGLILWRRDDQRRQNERQKE